MLNLVVIIKAFMEFIPVFKELKIVSPHSETSTEFLG
jgi:hypothetical protein